MQADAADSLLSRLGRAVPMRGRLLMIVTSIACAVLFTYTARAVRIPDVAGFGDAVPIDSARAPVSLLVIGVVLVVCAVAGTWIAGAFRFDAGLLCAVVGLSAVAFRTGTMGDLLRQNAATGSASVVLRLALEIVLLFALVGVAWSVIWVMHKSGRHRSDDDREGVDPSAADDPLYIKFAALGMQIGITGLLVLLFAQTDAKPQVLGAVFVASLVGAAITHHLYPVSPSPWFWVGPMFVGIVGYVIVYVKLDPADPTWQTGHLTMALAGLARPLPIDYAAAGPAGAILGYWMGRNTLYQQMLEAEAQANA
jgi:hypothetical protein